MTSTTPMSRTGSVPPDPGPGAGRWVAEAVGQACHLPLDRADVELLDRILRPVAVVAGTVVARAGTRPRHVHLIHSGRLDLVREMSGRQVVIGSLGPGEVDGDVAVLLDRPSGLDAVARTDSVLLALDRDDLIDLVARRSPLAMRWLTSLAARVAEGQERVGEVLAGHLDLRVAAVLLRRLGPGGRIDLTQAELAGLLGVQRSSVNDAIRRLETRGLVRRGYGHVVVVDPAALRRLLSC